MKKRSTGVEARADAGGLRERAEERLPARLPELGALETSPSLDQAVRLVHELQVHQIELEMQNDELRASREELEASRASYRELYDFAPIGYFTLRADGTIQAMNLAGASLLGEERSRLVGRRFALFLDDGDKPTFAAMLASAFDHAARARAEPGAEWRESAFKQSRELALAPPPGRPDARRHIALTLSSCQRTSDCRAVMIDVTEQRRMEEALRTAQKMEALGRIAGGVAHDFNNLLAVVLIHTELAREGADNPAVVRQELDCLKTAAATAANLTSQLLAFSRKQVFSPQRIDVNQLTRGLGDLLRRPLGETIELILRLTPDACPVELDPTQLERVLMNLILNARDAMPRGGTIVVTTESVVLDESHGMPASLAAQELEQAGEGSGSRAGMRSGKFVVLTVTDTGAGMDAETMTHIFEPFFTTKEKGRGTGFGLATCYGVVKQCGGEIVVWSEPGKGAMFKVYLPCAHVSRPPELAPAMGASKARGGTETILVVEDERALRALTERVLGGVGYKVLAAASGAEALQIGEEYEGPIDLVLSDMVMPKMSGVAFVAELRKLRPEVRVLYMSGYAGEGIDARGKVEAGAKFLGKPFTGETLKAKVREVLDADARH